MWGCEGKETELRGEDSQDSTHRENLSSTHCKCYRFSWRWELSSWCPQQLDLTSDTLLLFGFTGNAWQEHTWTTQMCLNLRMCLNAVLGSEKKPHICIFWKGMIYCIPVNSQTLPSTSPMNSVHLKWSQFPPPVPQNLGKRTNPSLRHPEWKLLKLSKGHYDWNIQSDDATIRIMKPLEDLLHWV